MGDFTLYILTAVSLIFVIEGLLYALFPDAIRKMMAMAVMMDVRKLRGFGAMMAVSGILLLWFFRSFAGG